MHVTVDGIRRHCAEIDRCNQRGGRMLSIVDLIRAGTMGPGLSAYALAAIGNGASFMVGALPGGAGKTTVMGALLNFVPPDVELGSAADMSAIEQGLTNPAPRRCLICHEIGRGPYYAYLWGETLRAYFELPGAGHMMATNLHADTCEQALDQVCGDNDIPESAFRRMNLLLFLSVERGGSGAKRLINAVWESDGRSPHRLLLSGPDFPDDTRSALVSPDDVASARAVIDRIVADGSRTIGQVRAAVLEHTNVA